MSNKWYIISIFTSIDKGSNWEKKKKKTGFIWDDGPGKSSVTSKLAWQHCVYSAGRKLFTRKKPNSLVERTWFARKQVEEGMVHRDPSLPAGVSPGWPRWCLEIESSPDELRTSLPTLLPFPWPCNVNHRGTATPPASQTVNSKGCPTPTSRKGQSPSCGKPRNLQKLALGNQW